MPSRNGNPVPTKFQMVFRFKDIFIYFTLYYFGSSIRPNSPRIDDFTDF